MYEGMQTAYRSIGRLPSYPLHPSAPAKASRQRP